MAALEPGTAGGWVPPVTIRTDSGMETLTTTASHRVQAIRRGRTETQPLRVQDLAIGEEIGVVRDLRSGPDTAAITGIDRFLDRAFLTA